MHDLRVWRLLNALCGFAACWRSVHVVPLLIYSTIGAREHQVSVATGR